MDNMKHRRLQELDRSDFEIVEGEPDIRGWDVKNEGGKKIGEVEDLIVDAKRKKVRYMVVDLDDNELDLDHRKVLLPIGLAQLHEKQDDVLIPGIGASQLAALPKYDREGLDEEMERSICSTLGRQSDSMSANKNEEEFYRHDYFNDDNLYKHRLHEAKRPRKSESEYESGLKLWERRSEGGLLGEDRGERSEEREREEERRMEMVRSRRNNYQQRRGGGGLGRDHYNDDRSSGRRDNSIEGRIRDEGLRDG